jgi:hypothetical protein
MAYRLLQPDGTLRESAEPGALGGNSTLKIYGRLDCARAIAALPLGYARHRVFFADEEADPRRIPPLRAMHAGTVRDLESGAADGGELPVARAAAHPMAAPPSPA